MNEVFDSKLISVECKEDDGIVLSVLKGKVIRDDFRTPMMHAADMAMRHNCKVLAIQFDEDPKLEEREFVWIRKVYLANLKKCGIESVYLIDSNELSVVKDLRSLFGSKFKAIVCQNYEEAKGRSTVKTDSSTSKFASMTREEALKYMGLDESADIKEIDDRFWTMSKKYRGKTDAESMAMEDEISTIYDIASGRAEARFEEEKRRENEKKYFGRYESDWKNIIHYNWKTWILAAVIVIAGLAVIIGYFTGLGSECSVLVFGHMYLDSTQMREALEEEGLKNPYVGLADMVVPNDENIPMDEMGNESFNAQFYTNPDVLISDDRCYLYYFNVFQDLSPLEEQIMAGLSDEAKAGIEPIYMSERESVRYKNDMYSEWGYDDEQIRNPQEFSDTPVLIGFRITDPDVITNYGVEAKWMSRQTTFVFGRCVNSTDDAKTVKMMVALINAAFKEKTV